MSALLFQPMEDLAQSWSRLTLSEREGPGYCLTQEESSNEFCIAAKFLTRRVLNMDVSQELVLHFGEHVMASESRILVITKCFLFLTTRQM